MAKADFLLEIGCEEIPVAYIEPAVRQLAAEFGAWLADERLAHGEIEHFATPRRLAIRIAGLDTDQAEMEEEVTGPPMAAAYKDGEPTKAALGFARGAGVQIADLYPVSTPKGEYLGARKRTPGRRASALLAEGIPERILKLRFPKTMIWGDGSLRFARPIRWLVALLGDEVVPAQLGTLRAGRLSHGHRLHAPDPIEIDSPAAYESALAAAAVIVDLDERRAAILAQAREAAAGLGGRLVEDAELLETVNFLVEKPLALAGHFDPVFLDLPRLVVTTAMKSHQRYFSVEDEAGRLLPNFIVILNGGGRDDELVRRGNERVLQARLQDARFYWEEDRAAGLSGMLKRLETVLWMEGFGSIAARCERLERLSGALAGQLGATELDADALAWAARYSKADLASEMVKDGKEFTKLQGYMGQEYARAEGAPNTRSAILYEQSFPRFAGDRLPDSLEGVLLALADRLDAVVGFWLAGFAPTGSKDPYALRRQALAILRLLREKELPISLRSALKAATAGYPDADAAALPLQLQEFFLGRFAGLLEEEGVAPDIFAAVAATGETLLTDLRSRALALNALRGDAEFEKLVIGARRVGNILAKEGRELAPADAAASLTAWALGERSGFGFDPALLAEAPERALCAALEQAAAAIDSLVSSHDFDPAYRRLASMGVPIDAYFDGVMVNSEDPALRGNRLAFLQNLGQIFLRFADFSRVVLEGERKTR